MRGLYSKISSKGYKEASDLHGSKMDGRLGFQDEYILMKVKSSNGTEKFRSLKVLEPESSNLKNKSSRGNLQENSFKNSTCNNQTNQLKEKSSYSKKIYPVLDHHLSSTNDGISTVSTNNSSQKTFLKGQNLPQIPNNTTKTSLIASQRKPNKMNSEIMLPSIDASKILKDKRRLSSNTSAIRVLRQKNSIEYTESSQDTIYNQFPDYYMKGVFNYFYTKDPKYKLFYEHISKSFSVLKNLNSDQCVEEIDISSIEPFPRSKKIVLALDLDETLAHCCNFDDDPLKSYQCVINYKSSKDRLISAKMNFRPYLMDFLESVSSHYDIVVYTASDSDYANAVVSFIDPGRKFIKDIYHREHCCKTKKGFIVKDLRKVLPFDSHNVILVDNSTHCFAPQIKSGIPIIPFTYDKKDTELLKLKDYLLDLASHIDTQKYLDRSFQLRSYTKFKSVDILIEHLLLESKKMV